MRPCTMFEKIWNDHLVYAEEGKPSLLYIDLHLVHEVTSPQAFEALRLAKRRVRRPDLTFATMDHNVPTSERHLPIADETARRQMEILARNCEDFEVMLFDLDSPHHGIVHVIGPELGLTQPGKTIVCGDSHTSTHGAFGALAFGIGTSEVEHVLATQCLWQEPPATFEIRIEGRRTPGVSAKDIILAIIGQIGTDGATGTVIEYTGPVVRAFSMEERMTLCNMTIEAGARAGMVAPDEITFDYLKGRPHAPQGVDFEAAVCRWRQLASDPGAHYDRTLVVDATHIEPQVTWGTSPGMVAPISGQVPDPASFSSAAKRQAAAKALEYMGLQPGTPLSEVAIDRVFIGSCTNSRLEDLRAAAAIAKGRQVAPGVQAMVVPGSKAIKLQAEAEGLHSIFQQAGFEWREPGCSMCLAMNPDVLQPGERCAATSNRNFEGRQGRLGRTHLVSPAMAAAAAIAGHFVDVRHWPTTS